MSDDDQESPEERLARQQLEDIGEEIERRLSDPIIRFLLERAQAEADAALQTIADTEMIEANLPKLQVAQNNLKRMRDMDAWMRQAIEAWQRAAAEVRGDIAQE